MSTTLISSNTNSIPIPTRPLIPKRGSFNRRFYSPVSNTTTTPSSLNSSVQSDSIPSSPTSSITSLTTTASVPSPPLISAIPPILHRNKPVPIRWNPDTIDNEHLQRKKTHCCLPTLKNGRVYHHHCQHHSQHHCQHNS